MSVCDVCIVAKQCVVLEQQLLLTAYNVYMCIVYVVLIDTKMNDLDLYIEFVEGHVSCQPLRHIVD